VRAVAVARKSVRDMRDRHHRMDTPAPDVAPLIRATCCIDFTARGRKFGGKQFQIYARAFARNIEQYGYHANSDISEIETAFVVTFSDGSNSPRVYNSMVQTLGNLVESAVIDQDIKIIR
jgi:hypothetical protein